MTYTELSNMILRYRNLIKLHNASLMNAKTKIERSIQRDIINKHESDLAKLLSLK